MKQKRKSSTRISRATSRKKARKHCARKTDLFWQKLCVGLLLGFISTTGNHSQSLAQVTENTKQSLVASSTQQPQTDAAIMAMREAYKQKDSATLSALLPQTQGHILEPWAAYWNLKLQLPQASNEQVDLFLQKYQGTYQEDRLRNDWLLELGKRDDLQNFARYYPQFRMRDDNAVRCYAILATDYLKIPTQEMQLLLQEAWFAKREAGSACNQAAQSLYQKGLLSEEKIWRKVWLSAELKRSGAAASAAEIITPELSEIVRQAVIQPTRFLETIRSGDTSSYGTYTGSLILTALSRLARSEHNVAAQYAQSLQDQLSSHQRDWAWAVIGKWAAVDLDPNANAYFQQVQQSTNLPNNYLEWKVRAALRSSDWVRVRASISAMPQDLQRKPVWAYWLARALQNGKKQPNKRPQQATTLLQRIAGHDNFYALLALEELQGRITAPRQTNRVTDQERYTMRSHKGLQRALYARALDLTSEARREWNYSTNLHLLGGMNDRDLLAAADLACKQQWWDRCINTSERTEYGLLLEQRFPTPYLNAITRYSHNAGLEPSWVLGLIRQESRFIHYARSHVGAGGLMQVMPGTARLVERELGIERGNSLDIEHNINLGTGYLSMMYNKFGGSMAMASAAYNAGPARPKQWRVGAPLEGAIWVETIPFSETRNYVKKVLSNSVLYALRLHNSKQQSLYQRLGNITPAPIEELEAALPNDFGNPTQEIRYSMRDAASKIN